MFIEPYYSPDIVLDPGDTMVLMVKWDQTRSNDNRLGLILRHR